MLKIAVQYLKLTHILTIYHRSDLEEDQIASDNPTHKDVGKYYGYKDGSGWYAKVLLVRPSYFRTTLGICRRGDIVIQSKVHFSNASYCGLLRSDTSFHIKRPTLRERKVVGDILKLGKYPKAIDNRVRAMLLDRLREKCEELNIDEDFIIRRLHKEAINDKNRGMERISAVQILARINGIETEKQDPRFVQNNNYLGVQQYTIQDQRRQAVPALSKLKATVELLRSRGMDDNELVEIVEDDRFPALPGLNRTETKEMEAEIVGSEPEREPTDS